MKKIIYILFFLPVFLNAQVQFVISGDSLKLKGKKTFLWYNSNILADRNWVRSEISDSIPPEIDTISLSNRINTKLASADTNHLSQRIEEKWDSTKVKLAIHDSIVANPGGGMTAAYGQMYWITKSLTAGTTGYIKGGTTGSAGTANVTVQDSMIILPQGAFALYLGGGYQPAGGGGMTLQLYLNDAPISTAVLAVSISSTDEHAEAMPVIFQSFNDNDELKIYYSVVGSNFLLTNFYFGVLKIND